MSSETFSKEYIEIAQGHVSKRNQLIEFKNLARYVKSSDELYRSMFTLEDSAFSHFQQGKSIKDYQGKYKLNHIIYDIDKGADTGSFCQDRAMQFVMTLEDKGVKKDHIQIWFSGRGFHIEMPDYFGFNPSDELPAVVKRTLHKEFGNEIDNIYDKGRLIRVNYSLNRKSGLYKTPLKYEELQSMDFEDILIISKDFKREDFKPKHLPKVQPVWHSRIQSASSTLKNTNQVVLDVRTDRKYVPHVICVQKMAEVINNSKGQRHAILLRIANSWRRSGISRQGISLLVRQVVPSLPVDETERIIDSVFSWEHNGFSCNDPIMEKFCDSKCRYYQARNFGVQALTTDMLAKRLTDFVMQDYKHSFDLKEIYNMQFHYKFNPGEFAVCMGDVKLGKTAWIQNLVTSVRHLKTLFLSLEVHDQLIFRRFIQIANSVNKDEVLNVFREEQVEKQKKWLNAVRHISVICKQCDMDGLKEEILNQDAKLVVIDTLDGLTVKGYNDPFKKQEAIAIGLKQMAQDLNVIIIGISHISKSASYDAQKGALTVHSAKGNSALEQKADKVIAIEGHEKSLNRRVKSLASRDENGFEINLTFNKQTMEFTEQ